MGTSFGRWLKQRRKALGLSQQELAGRVGCSAALIRKIEGDERRPSRQIAELIVQQVSLDDDREALLRLARVRPTQQTVSANDQPASSQVSTLAASRLLSPLTERESEILKLILADLADSIIAERLSLKISTMRWYVKQIYSKLGVHSRDELMEQAEGIAVLNVSERTEAAFIELPMAVNRSVPRLANALPQDIADRYVGREQEAAELTHLLRSRTRLVSVYGRSGVGKTALICKVLADLLKSEDAPDGVVSLGATTTNVSLSQVITGFAGLLDNIVEQRLANLAQDGESSPSQKVKVLLEALRQGWYILLLDNLETLQNPATGELLDSDLQALFQAALEQGGISILITSQMQLGLDRALLLSERRVQLHDGLSEDDAISLLRQFDPDDSAGLRDASETVLQQCVQITHGYPRALEAVVGILLEDPLLPVEHLLNDTMRLSGEITAIVQQAISRLDPLAIEVMQALSVFPRSVSLDAIAWVLDTRMDTITLRSVLSHLVRGYFVRYNRADQQFSLHPIDQETVYHLTPPQDGEMLSRRALHTRAADYFRQQHKPRQEWKQFEDVVPVLDEYEQRLLIEDYDEAARLLLLIDHDYLWEWGQYALLQSLHDRLRGHIRDAFVNRQHLRRLGWLKWTRDTDGAAQLFEQVLTSAREAGDRQSEADALDDLAQIARKRGIMQDGLRYHQQALTLYRTIGDRRGQAEALGGIGSVLLFVDPDLALTAFTEALDIHREMENAASLAYSLNSLGNAHRNLGEYEPARAYLSESLAFCQQRGIRAGETFALRGLGLIEQDFGNSDMLAEYGLRLLEVGRETDLIFASTEGFEFLGRARFALGEYEQGQADLRHALELARQENRSAQVIMAGVILAQSLLWTRKTSEAATVLDEMERYAPTFPPFLMTLGLVQACMGDALALMTFEQCMTRIKSLSRQGRPPLWELYNTALVRTAIAFLTGGDMTPGLLDYRAALACCSPQGLVREQLDLLGILRYLPNGERLSPILDALKLALPSEDRGG
jgi:DNA-binding CsgD family transcriptional regulator/tetratricopeptide (TPR) repeat protein/DNA-binding XRE family transcriptional regulator